LNTDLHKLLLAMHRGHEPSAQKLWALLAPRLLAYAGSVLPRDLYHASDDIVQAVFCSILDRPKRELKKIENPTAWLFRLTRNAAINHTRSERREHNRRSNAHTNTDPNQPEASSLESLKAAAAQLTTDHQEIILLRFVAGLSLDQASIALDINPNTLASRHKAAVLSLRSILNGDSQTHSLSTKGTTK
jgi:RNA polymerase sigma factor (sigma-70 family)